MNDVEPLGTPRMLLSLVAASIIGCFVFSFFEATGTLLNQVIATVFFNLEWRSPQFWDMLGFYTLFGMPVAVVLCLLIGFPVWKYAESRPLRSTRSSLGVGAGVGAAIGLLLLLFSLALGLQTFLDDSAEFNTWKFGYQITRDGIPTAIGWLYELKTLIFFAISGGIAGMAAKRVAFPI